MFERKNPPSQAGSSGPAVDGHMVRLTRVKPEAQAALMTELHMKLPEMKSTGGKQIRPHAAPIDEFLNQYPEARQIRATIPCPACKVEIPVPHGSLRAYVEHLKANDPAVTEGVYRLEIRVACRIQTKA